MESSFAARQFLVKLNIAGFLLLSTNYPAYSGVITSSAFINLIDGPYQNSSGMRNSAISSSAGGAGGSAVGSADTNMHLRTNASSIGSTLINDAGAGAGFLSAFHVLGDDTGIVLPLTFNFTISGTISATSAAGHEESIANAGIQYDVQTAANRFLGGATLTSQAGIPTGATTGDLVGDVSLNGFTGITYTFDSNFSLPVTLSSTTVDALSATLSSVASSTPGASASSDFSHTLTLTSITLPSDFSQVNPSHLQVAFDSGLTLPVTAAVPEPSSLFLLATGLAFVSISRNRWLNALRRTTG